MKPTGKVERYWRWLLVSFFGTAPWLVFGIALKRFSQNLAAV
jgi:hypothetical protein